MKKIMLLVCIKLLVINEAIGAVIHSPCKSDNAYVRISNDNLINKIDN